MNVVFLASPIIRMLLATPTWDCTLFNTVAKNPQEFPVVMEPNYIGREAWATLLIFLTTADFPDSRESLPLDMFVIQQQEIAPSAMLNPFSQSLGEALLHWHIMAT